MKKENVISEGRKVPEKGDIFYDVTRFGDIRWYYYVCIHPTNPHYHILMNANKEPERIFEKDLCDILDKGLKTRKDAVKEKIKFLEERLEYYKKEYGYDGI